MSVTVGTGWIKLNRESHSLATESITPTGKFPLSYINGSWDAIALIAVSTLTLIEFNGW